MLLNLLVSNCGIMHQKSLILERNVSEFAEFGPNLAELFICGIMHTKSRIFRRNVAEFADYGPNLAELFNCCIMH